jgi:hypothetical protein
MANDHNRIHETILKFLELRAVRRGAATLITNTLALTSEFRQDRDLCGISGAEYKNVTRSLPQRAGFKTFLLALAFAVCAGAPPAAATYMTGNRLLVICAGIGEMNTLCVAYIMGVSDALDDIRYAQGQDPCTPAGSTPERLSDLVRGWLIAHPNHGNEDAAWQVMKALAEVSNCSWKSR